MSPAHAWHRAAHNMTAEIAFKLLNEEQQQHVVAMLSSHPRFKKDFAAAMPKKVSNGPESERGLWLFQRASNWPDVVRNASKAVRGRYDRPAWHYINLPVYLTDQDEAELVGSLDQNLAVTFEPPLRRNLNIIQALQGNLLVWHDATASDADKAVAFCWILHLTGDMHEPLHNVALFSRNYFPDGDHGGNSIAIKRNGDVTNLHVVWDALLNGVDSVSLDEKTREILSNDVVSIRSISDWAVHHQGMAQKFVYTKEVKTKILQQVSSRRDPEISLSPEYLASAGQLAKSQVIIAGHRIAALITN